MAGTLCNSFASVKWVYYLVFGHDRAVDFAPWLEYPSSVYVRVASVIRVAILGNTFV